MYPFISWCFKIYVYCFEWHFKSWCAIAISENFSTMIGRIFGNPALKQDINYKFNILI